MKKAFAIEDDRVFLTASLSDDGLKLFLDAEPKPQCTITGLELHAILSKHSDESLLNKGVIDIENPRNKVIIPDLFMNH
jgi:hypothetical protein